NLKVTFLVGVIAFGGLLFVAFAAVTSYWVAHDLREQFHRRGELLLDNLAAEAVRSLALEDATERRLHLLLLTHRATIEDVAYAQVIASGQVVSESFQSDTLPLDAVE